LKPKPHIYYALFLPIKLISRGQNTVGFNKLFKFIKIKKKENITFSYTTGASTSFPFGSSPFQQKNLHNMVTRNERRP